MGDTVTAAFSRGLLCSTALAGLLAGLAVTDDAFGQCVPTTAPVSGQTVTCSGADVITTPVNAAAGSTGVTINIAAGTTVRGAHDTGVPLVLVGVHATSAITNNGTLILSGTGSAAARGVAMLGNESGTGGLSNTLSNFGTITTTGAYNVGMAASGGGNLLFNGSTGIITTTGAYAYGMSSGWLPSGNIQGTTTANTVTNNGRVEVSGSNSRAVSVIGSNSTVNNGTQFNRNATLLATGSNSWGVYLNGTNDSLTNYGLIQTTGSGDAYAVNANMVSSALETRITNAAGGRIVSASAPAVNVSSGIAHITNGGLIESDGGVAIRGNDISSLDLNLRVTSNIIGAVNGGASSAYGNTLTLMAQNTATDGPTAIVGSVTNAFANFTSLTVAGISTGNPVSNWRWTGSGTFNAVTVASGARLMVQNAGAIGTTAGGTMAIAAGGTLELGGLGADGNLQAAGTLTAANGLTDDGTLLFNHNGTLIFGAAIGGAGQVIVQNGTTALTANNDYSGGTRLNGGVLAVLADANLGAAGGGLTFDGGTLRTLADFSTGRAVMLDAGGGTFDTSPGSLAITSVIAGSGGLTKTGAGTLALTNANTYAGGTTLNDGQLVLSGSGTPGATTGALTINGGMLALFGTSQTVGALAGTGGTIIDGSGSGSALTVNQSGDTVWAGTFDNTFGGLALTKDGTGILTLTGASSSVSDVEVAGGTLAFAQTGEFAVAGGYTTKNGASTTIGANAKLAVTGTFTQEANATLNVAIGLNNGAVTADSAILDATSTLNIAGYSGISFAVIKTTSGITSDPFGFGTVSIGGATTTGVDYLSVHGHLDNSNKDYVVDLGLTWNAGPGTVQDSGSHGTFTLDGTGESFDVGAVLEDQTPNVNAPGNPWDGKTLTKEGAGTLILSDVNTYTGDTYVNEGTLQLGNGGPAGSIAAVSEVKLLAGTTLAFNRSDEPVFVGNRITGAGSVEQIGSGVIVLTNENDYSGGTRVLNGTLQLGSATYGHGSIIGAVTTEGGSLWIANSDTTGITTIDNNNGGSTRFFISQNADKIEITNNAGGLTEFNNDSSAGQATIKNNSGETDFYDRSTAGSAEIFNDGGGLIYFFDKSTAGSARITNSNQSYTLFVSAPPNSGGTPSAGNATIINETGGITFFGASSGAGNATIINNDGSATGFFEDSSAGNAAITNKAGGQTGFFGNSTADAATITNEAGSVTYFSGNSTAGSAVLVNQGDSLFDFSGTTGPGGLGQVSAGSIAGEGTFALGANRLTVGGNGDSTTVSGVITDGGLYGGAGGSIVKTGSGTLTLGGINAYTGGTTIGNGKLVATNGNALGSGAIVNDAALVLDFANDGTLTGALSGAGSLTKTGAGIATLSADNSSQGDVTVEAGALRFEQTGTFTAKSYETQGGAATTVGAHAQLIVTNGFTTAGIVDNEGTIKGALTQSAGTTTNNGGITGLATIDGGLFTGIGSAGGLKVAGGAIVAPGIDGGIGAMRVDGDVAFAAGSIYRVAINGAGDGSRIDAGGKAVIDGGTVDVRAGSGNYAPATSYVILTAEDGRTGEFTGVTSDLTFLSLFLAYDANTVILTTVRNDISFADVGDTPNQIATGGGAEGLGHGNPVWDALVQLDAPGARAAFDQLSGEVHASARTALIEDSRFVREAALDRLRTAGEDAGEDGRAAAWGRAFGSWGRTGSDGNAARLARSTGGFVMGVDAGLSETVRAGLLGGYSHTSFDSARGQGDSDNYHLGAYAGGRWGAVSLRAGAARTWHRLLTARRVTFPNFADSLTAHYKANTTQVFGEAGYSITGKAVTLEPFAGIAYVDLHTDGFAEKGGAAALTARGGNTAITFSTLGLRGSTGFGADGIKAEAMLGWRHAFGDVVPRSAMAFAGGDEFTVAGVPLARNVAAIEAGLTMPIGSKAGIGVSYSGQFGSGVTDNGVRANFRLQF